MFLLLMFPWGRGGPREAWLEAGARQDAESQKEEQEWELEDSSRGEVLG